MEQTTDELLRELVFHLRGGWGTAGLLDRVKALEKANAERQQEEVIRDAILIALRWTLTLMVPACVAILIAVLR